MPEPPPLMKLRVSQANPFEVTGIDFTGALFVRIPNGEQKAYICLFNVLSHVQFTLKLSQI